MTGTLGSPFLGHRHVRQGLPEVLLQTLTNRKDDTSHISDYTHQPKANSNADAPRKAEPMEVKTNDEEKGTTSVPADPPSGFQLELGVIASSIGSLFKQAPNLIQTAVKNLPIVKQNPKIFARNVEKTDQESDNEISNDLTTPAGDIESLEDNSIEESSPKSTTSTTTHTPPPHTTREMESTEPFEIQEEDGIFSRFLTTIKSGFYLLKTVLVPAPKHDPKAIEPPNTAFVTALENVMSFLQPLLSSRQPSNRSKRNTNENDSDNQERFYNLIERTVFDRFRFDSEVQKLQAKIIFRESFVRYAEINLLTELTEERIQHLVTFLKGLNQYRNHTSSSTNGETDNTLPQEKSQNADFSFAIFEKSANSESIFILFVEILGTVAGLAWGTFSQFLWLISSMGSS